MRVLGMISGTSHDGIDAAAVEFQMDGPVLRGRIVHHGMSTYDGPLRARLLAALPPAETTLAEVCELDTLIGQAFARAAIDAIGHAGPVDAIASHGQTVYHWVEGSRCLGTLQIGQAAWIAEATGVPVISDLRIRDITAGGHGAPLVSFLDSLLLTPEHGTTVALNLGGISNMTVLSAAATPVAHDIGPANALLDAVVVDRAAHPAGFDSGGRLAASGNIDDALLQVLLDDPYYSLPAPKSTGKELFHLDYVRAACRRAGREPGTADLLATLAELTAITVARDVQRSGADRVIAAGGGCENRYLMTRLRHHLGPVRLLTTDDVGAPTAAKEAVAFALLGWCTLHGLPGTVPSATGATGSRVLGTITPGEGPLALPPAGTRPPTRLVLEVDDRR